MRRGRMRCEAAEHPLVYAEPPFYSKAAREQIVERLFESFGSPAVFLAKNPVLASFALGRQTSLVIDVGHDGTVGARPMHAPLCFAHALRSLWRVHATVLPMPQHCQAHHNAGHRIGRR